MNTLAEIHYRLPGENTIHLIKGPSKSLDLNNCYNHFIIAPFNFPNESGIMLEMDKQSIVALDELTLQPHPLSLDPFDNPTLPDFVDLVNEAKATMTKSDMNKVVLSRLKSIEFNANQSLHYFGQLCQAYPNAFVYHINTHEFGKWMGATPELLLQKNQNRFKTVSLAGTRKSGSNEQWGEKEKEEQDIVTNYIIGRVAKFASNEIEVSDLRTSAIGPVAHIKKEISFQSDKPAELLISLHPTPAVCGMPKELAFDFIQKHEGYNRELYTGFLGPVTTDKQMDLFVNLRCMKIFNTMANLYIGAGITKDSQAQDEFQETENKAQVLQSVIQPNAS